MPSATHIRFALILSVALHAAPLSAQVDGHAPEPQEAPADQSAAAMPAGRHKRFGDWSTVQLDMSHSRLCFAVTKARAGAGRGAPAVEPAAGHVHVAAWPEAGVRAEVSIRAGAPLRQGIAARIIIGGEQFTLFTHDDGAYVEDPIDELKLLEAMKKGSQMAFTAQTQSGNAVSETFSLTGFGAALTHVTRGCP